MKPFALLITVIFIISCNHLKNKESAFIFIKNEQGIELQENGQKIFFYQKAPLLSGPEYFNHYIHPLYNLSGEPITRAFPEEEIDWHYNHRGIYWGWRQMFIKDEKVGDGWVMENIRLDIKNVQTLTDDKKAQMLLNVHWITNHGGQTKAFIDEHTKITVYSTQDGLRNIDFEIRLKAFIQGVEIAGSHDNHKGYGGFSTRIVLADSLLYRSENGPVEPQEAQLHVGPWVDFSTTGLSVPNKFGLTILCHPSIPNHPSPWLLRRKGSMQNPAFPGWDRTEISIDKETILRYRLVLHNGDAEISEIKKWYSNYATTNHD